MFQKAKEDEVIFLLIYYNNNIRITWIWKMMMF